MEVSRRYSLFILLIAAVAVTVMYFFIYLPSRREMIPINIEEEPMISHEAVTLYDMGAIGKLDALRRIDLRLDELKARGAISDWDFRAEDSRYRIYMNNGAQFVYYLK